MLVFRGPRAATGVKPEAQRRFDRVESNDPHPPPPFCAMLLRLCAGLVAAAVLILLPGPLDVARRSAASLTTGLTPATARLVSLLQGDDAFDRGIAAELVWELPDAQLEAAASGVAAAVRMHADLRNVTWPDVLNRTAPAVWRHRIDESGALTLDRLRYSEFDPDLLADVDWRRCAELLRAHTADRLNEGHGHVDNVWWETTHFSDPGVDAWVARFLSRHAAAVAPHIPPVDADLLIEAGLAQAGLERYAQALADVATPEAIDGDTANALLDRLRDFVIRFRPEADLLPLWDPVLTAFLLGEFEADYNGSTGAEILAAIVADAEALPAAVRARVIGLVRRRMIAPQVLGALPIADVGRFVREELRTTEWDDIDRVAELVEAVSHDEPVSPADAEAIAAMAVGRLLVLAEDDPVSQLYWAMARPIPAFASTMWRAVVKERRVPWVDDRCALISLVAPALPPEAVGTALTTLGREDASPVDLTVALMAIVFHHCRNRPVVPPDGFATGMSGDDLAAMLGAAVRVVEADPTLPEHEGIAEFGRLALRFLALHAPPVAGLGDALIVSLPGFDEHGLPDDEDALHEAARSFVARSRFVPGDLVRAWDLGHHELHAALVHWLAQDPLHCGPAAAAAMATRLEAFADPHEESPRIDRDVARLLTIWWAQGWVDLSPPALVAFGEDDRYWIMSEFDTARETGRAREALAILRAMMEQTPARVVRKLILAIELGLKPRRATGE
jgi:hypothetical protein